MNDHSPQLARMPWYPRDFRSATLGWPLAARAVYRELLDAQWDLGSLPTDDEALRSIAAATPGEWRIAWPIVSAKFKLDEQGRLRNHRLERHRARDIEVVEKRRKAANTRWGTDSDATPGSGVNGASAGASADAHASGLHGDVHMPPTPTPTPTPSEDPSVASATSGDHNGAGRTLVGSAPAKRNGIDRALHEAVVAAYHELLPDLPAVKIWNDRRRKKLAARIRDTLDRGKPADAVEWWQRFFETVAASDFLCGRKTEWSVPGLEWLLEPRNFEKVIEGAYTNRRSGHR